MSLIGNFEERLERAVEGFFARLFKSGVHPVEIGKRLLRVMEDGKTVALRRTYVPNLYRITVGPKDYERLSQLEAKLVEELEIFVGEAARQRQWSLPGLPARVVRDRREAAGRRVPHHGRGRVALRAESPAPRRQPAAVEDRARARAAAEPRDRRADARPAHRTTSP